MKKSNIYFILSGVVLFFDCWFYAFMWQLAPLRQIAGAGDGVYVDGVYVDVDMYLSPLSHIAFIVGLLIAGGLIAWGIMARKDER